MMNNMILIVVALAVLCTMVDAKPMKGTVVQEKTEFVDNYGNREEQEKTEFVDNYGNREVQEKTTIVKPNGTQKEVYETVVQQSGPGYGSGLGPGYGGYSGVGYNNYGR